MKFSMYITTLTDGFFDRLVAHLVDNRYTVSAGGDGASKHYIKKSSICFTILSFTDATGKITNEQAFDFIKKFFVDNKFSYLGLIVEGTGHNKIYSPGEFFDNTIEEEKVFKWFK